MQTGKRLFLVFLLTTAVSAKDGDITKTIPLGLPSFVGGHAQDFYKVDYGKFLFSSRILSKNGSVACISCHIPKRAFSDGLKKSFGVTGKETARNTPSIQNLYAFPTTMHDGRAPLELQPLEPLENPNEMDVQWEKALLSLSDRSETTRYLEQSGKTILGRDDIVDSLASYLRTLVSGESRFDMYYYASQATLTTEEIEGLTLFKGKAGCTSCHLISSDFALFTDGAYHSLGLGFAGDKYSDIGRGGITGLKSDNGKFKTPTLRNISKTEPYMHDGSLESLQDVLKFYNLGGRDDALGKDIKIKPLHLTDNEINLIIIFLKSLDSFVYEFQPR